MAHEQGSIALPGYTHMQQAMPSSVALWAQGFAAEIRDDIEGLRHAHRRIGKNPLGSAAGYGTPNLPVNRDGTRRRLDLPANHEPVTAVQLSRGKARGRGAVPGHAADAGPRPAGVGPAAVLHARVRLRAVARRVHDRLVDHAAEAQSRRVRTRARPHGDGAGMPVGGARHHGQAAVGLSARPAADQGAAVPLDRPVPSSRSDIMAAAIPQVRFRAGPHPHGRGHSRGGRGQRTGRARKASRSARRTSASARSTAAGSNAAARRRVSIGHPTQLRAGDPRCAADPPMLRSGRVPADTP